MTNLSLYRWSFCPLTEATNMNFDSVPLTQDSEDVQSQSECVDSLWQSPHIQQRLLIRRGGERSAVRSRIKSCLTGTHTHTLDSMLSGGFP